MIKRAIISVYDKKGLEELVDVLKEFDFEIVSTGGTARNITELGYPNLKEVADYTMHPESPGGLLKTLHPKIHGGLLLNMEDSEHREYMDSHGIKPFDIAVVNLYPFEEVATRKAELKDAAENIDIGGPTMIRSAAKAALLYERVAIVTDPSQYGEVADALRANNGEIEPELKRRLAEKAFKRTAQYENAIASYLEGLEE